MTKRRSRSSACVYGVAHIHEYVTHDISYIILYIHILHSYIHCMMMIYKYVHVKKYNNFYIYYNKIRPFKILIYTKKVILKLSI